MKKSKLFLFGLAALLAAGLLVTGCEQPTAGGIGPGGSKGPAVVGNTISSEALQYLIDSGAPIVLDNTTIDDAGYVDLKSANIRIVGTFKLDTGSILNAVNATFDFGETGTINTVSGALWVLPESFKVSDWPVGSITAAAIVNPSGTIAALDTSLKSTKKAGFTTGLTLGDSDVLTIPTGAILIVGGSGSITAGSTNKTSLKAGTYEASGGNVTLTGSTGVLAIGSGLVGTPNIEANNLTALPEASVALIAGKVKYTDAITAATTFGVDGFAGELTFGGGFTSTGGGEFTAVTTKGVYKLGAGQSLPANTTLTVVGSEATLKMGAAATITEDFLFGTGNTDNAVLDTGSSTLTLKSGKKLGNGNAFAIATATDLTFPAGTKFTATDANEVTVNLGGNLSPTTGGTITLAAGVTIETGDYAVIAASGGVTIEGTVVTGGAVGIVGATTGAQLTVASTGIHTGSDAVISAPDATALPLATLTNVDAAVKVVYRGSVAATGDVESDFAGTIFFGGNQAFGGKVTFVDALFFGTVTFTSEKAISATGSLGFVPTASIASVLADPAVADIISISGDLTPPASASGALTYSKTDKTLTFVGVGVGASGAAVDAYGNTSIRIGDATKGLITLSKGGIDIGTGTIGAATGNAALTLENDDAIVLADGGSITVTGDVNTDALLALPNSTFGVGAYTATGTVTITAVAGSGSDTILTAAKAGDGLKIAATVGAESNFVPLTAKAANAATFTAVKSAGGATQYKVEFAAGGITLKAGTTTGTTLTATGTGAVGVVTVNGTGGITLVSSDSDNKSGKLKLLADAELVGITTSDADTSGTALAAAVNGSFKVLGTYGNAKVRSNASTSGTGALVSGNDNNALRVNTDSTTAKITTATSFAGTP